MALTKAQKKALAESRQKEDKHGETGEVIITTNPNEPVAELMTCFTATTFDELIIVGKSNALTNTVAVQLEAFSEMSKTTMNETSAINNRYQLYLIIQSVTDKVDGNDFSKNFELITHAFRLGQQCGFSSSTLSLYDYLWTFGADARYAFQLMYTVINATCSKEAKAKNKGKINIRALFNHIPPLAVTNLSRFYELT